LGALLRRGDFMVFLENIIHMPFEIATLMFTSGNYENNLFISSVMLVITFGVIGYAFSWIKYKIR
jgi:TctA family transporter